jgi:hypothetical protein
VRLAPWRRLASAAGEPLGHFPIDRQDAAFVVFCLASVESSLFPLQIDLVHANTTVRLARAGVKRNHQEELQPVGQFGKQAAILVVFDEAFPNVDLL